MVSCKICLSRPLPAFSSEMAARICCLDPSVLIPSSFKSPSVRVRNASISTSCSSKMGWYFSSDNFLRIPVSSSSSVMVPLLEPPLLLDCRWDEEEDTEDSAVWPLGEGEGVSVGEVLLEVVEVPDGGLLLVSSFLPPRPPPPAGETGSSDGLDPGAGPTGLDQWLDFCSHSPAAFFRWAAIWDRTLSMLPPGKTGIGMTATGPAYYNLGAVDFVC